MDPSTRAARAPGRPDAEFRGFVPPIVPSTSYERDAGGEYPGGHSYSRDQNPTGEPAEELLAQLEGGAESMVFASGMAAATALLDALPQGAGVVAPEHMYWTMRLWLERERDAGRLAVRFARNDDREAWRQAIAAGDTQLVWIETPANPLGDVCDIAAVSEIAREHGAVVAVDNTTPTPAQTRPIEHGAHVVFHSATKQLNGHGDVLAGALVAADEFVDSAVWEGARFSRGYRGAVLGPFEAWLLLRGMRTLYVRVPRSSESALAIATALQSADGVSSGVSEVIYPGLATHPGHEVAAKQMDGFGMLVSFRVEGGAERARAVANRLELFGDGTSLGSTHSLVEHRAPIEGAGTSVPDDLLRLSIGLESPDDLIADLRHALQL